MDKKIYKFKKMTPTNAADLSVYKEAIDYVFDNDDIRNIAISGAYSSGKSSILESYKKQNPNFKFMHISLAHFKTVDGADSEVKDTTLEGKILNQLMHQIPADKIKQTNFNVKKTSSFKRNIFSVVLLMILIVLGSYIKFFNLWSTYITSLKDSWIKDIFINTTNSSLLLISGIIITGILSYGIYKLIEIQNNKNIFRKIRLQGSEIEIFQEKEDSYFDKYLNEVLYLFENTNVGSIVFEDIDRFDGDVIFERLREINMLINIRRYNEDNSPLRFFYLIRDDIFISKDRTKFFEFIIPIIPVLDSSNSCDKVNEIFKDSHICYKFDDNFLQGLSLYIDDMRLLINIYNEFTIYFNKLNTIELDCNKMLSIIVYKNLFPRDFNQLQLNQGFVCSLFNNRYKFIEDEINLIQDKINEKREKIDQIKKEFLITIDELTLVYDSKRTSNYYGLDPLTEELNKELMRRKEVIESSREDLILKTVNEIDSLNIEKNNINRKCLKEIITRENIDSIFKIETVNGIGKEINFNDIRSSEYFDLLKYLIRNGYIDETYNDYMTYFYENNITRGDKMFLRSIVDKRAKEYEYKLLRVDLIIKRLKSSDFKQEEVLNFDLFKYLLENDEWCEFKKILITQLKMKNNYKFIVEYSDAGYEADLMMRELNIIWTEFLYNAINEFDISKKNLDNYLYSSICNNEIETLVQANIDESISEYISFSHKFLLFNYCEKNKIINIFKALNVSFEKLYYEKDYVELFKSIYKESLYKLNFENISIILNNIFNIIDDSFIKHKNYTLIRKNETSSLNKYINKNMEVYLTEVVNNCSELINDDEECAIELLNNQSLTFETKHKYLGFLVTLIKEIEKIHDKNLYEILIKKKKVAYSEINILEYYKEKGLDECLIKFINENNQEIIFSQYKSVIDPGVAEKFWDDLILCNELIDIKYKEIVSSFWFEYDRFDIKGIDLSKVNILIDNSIINMTNYNLEFIREEYVGNKMNFIKNNIEEYSNIICEDNIRIDEINEIIMWNVSDEVIIKVLSSTSEEISVISKKIETKVLSYILENNIMLKELNDILNCYKNYENDIKVIIEKIVCNNINYIGESSIEIPFVLLEKLLEYNNISDDIKIDVFITQVKYFNVDKVKKCFNYLNLDGYCKVFEGRTRPKFVIDSNSEKILSSLKNKGFINQFYEDEKNLGYYKVVKSRFLETDLKNELM